MKKWVAHDWTTTRLPAAKRIQPCGARKSWTPSIRRAEAAVEQSVRWAIIPRFNRTLDPYAPLFYDYARRRLLVTNLVDTRGVFAMLAASIGREMGNVLPLKRRARRTV